MKKLFFSALVFAALTSCTEENLVVQNPVDFSDVEVTFATSVAARVTTADAWEATDQIGIYMVQDGTEITSNTLFAYDDSSSAFTSATSLYYPNSGKNVNFYAYYPYENSTSKLRTVDIATQKPFLEAETESSYNKDSGATPVVLTFKHRLAYVELDFVGGDGLEDIQDLGVSSVNITGMISEGQYSLTYKMFTADGFADTDTQITLSKGDDGTWGFYMLPTSDGTSTDLYSLEGAYINVKCSYGDFSAHMKGYQIASNTKSTCTVSVNYSEITGLGGSIESWKSAGESSDLELTY